MSYTYKSKSSLDALEANKNSTAVGAARASAVGDDEIR